MSASAIDHAGNLEAGLRALSHRWKAGITSIHCSRVSQSRQSRVFHVILKMFPCHLSSINFLIPTSAANLCPG